MSGKRVANKPVEAQRRGGSTYFVVGPDGEKHKYAGVTTVLGEIAKPFLLPWAAKLAAEAVFENPEIELDKAKNMHLSVRDAAGDRGTAVHSYAEAWANGAPLDPADAPENIRGYVTALVSYFAEHSPEIVYNECVVVSDTYEYAGTADGIGIDQAGKCFLLDYKTSKSVYDWDNGLQLSAYENADFIVDPQTRLPVEVPDIEYALIVHLKPSGKYALHKMDAPFTSFLAYLHLYRSRAGKPCPPACPLERSAE